MAPDQANPPAGGEPDLFGFTPPPRRIICLASNRKRSGKTSCAHAIARTGFRPLSFATPGRVFATQVLTGLGYTHHQASALLTTLKDEPLAVLGGHTARSLLIGMLNGARRDSDPAVWARLAGNTMLNNPKINYVIDDMRFAIERHTLDAMGLNPFVVFVHRPDLDDTPPDPLSDILPEHCDVTLTNDGSPADLTRALLSAIL